mmetsp:Transcript_2310/g.3100  ORF Transcript_2310/g.3100 Transcript_2310/m.3100 type:complete len:197 (-) Transcript_2310:322-912(-)
MFKLFSTLALLSFFATETTFAHQFETSTIHLTPSHDTFVRKDRKSESYGNNGKITITKAGSKQRIGLMKFDTSEHIVGSDGSTKVSLRLGVAETHDSKPVDVKIYKLKGDFHEDSIDWNALNGSVEKESHVEFTVLSEYKDSVGEVDVTNLLSEGEDTVFAFVVENEGHVKFHSKEHSAGSHMTPKLVINRNANEF